MEVPDVESFFSHPLLFQVGIAFVPSIPKLELLILRFEPLMQ